MEMCGTLGLDLDATLIHGPLGTVIADLDAQVAREQGITGIHDEVMAEGQRLFREDPAAAYDWQETLARVCARRGALAPFDIVERLEEVAPSRTRLLETDAVQILQGIRSQGWRLVVITNGWRRYQVPALRAVDLLDVIDDLVTADSAGAPKPDGPIFAAALAGGGAGPLVHLGDRLDDDVLGAHRAGGRAVLYCPTAPSALRGCTGPREEQAREAFLADLAARQSARIAPDDPAARPDAIISSLHELPGILDAWT
jgi:HAD superfamily hydrolase (TIGR01549 family)